MAYRPDYRRKVITFVNEGGSKRDAVRLFKVALAWDAQDYREAMLGERAERFAVHVKTELLALRKLKRIKTIA
jgi:hypothetical protein